MKLFTRKKIKLLDPPGIGIAILITTFINGKQSKQFYGNSLVGNFLQFIYGKFNDLDTINFPASGSPWSTNTGVKRTNGTVTSMHTAADMRINAGTGDLAKGMIFGIGTTTPAPADYVVETLIDEGTATNEMEYQTQTGIQGCEINSLITNFIVQRIAVNNSGAQIDVTEICLYVYTLPYTVMLFRDSFSPADEVPDGGDYRVTLELSITT